VVQHPSVGIVQFTDGVSRPVYLDSDGRQFVVDAGGERVHGMWVYVDEPAIVARAGVNRASAQP